MDENRLKYLLERYHHQLCSDEELAVLNNWFHTFNTGSKNMESWLQAAGGEEQLSNALYEDFKKKLNRKQKYTALYQVLKVAASVIITLAIGLLLYRSNKPKTNPVQRIAVQKVNQTSINPSGKKATLTLANGNKIVLDDTQAGLLGTQENTKINKTAYGEIAYSASKDRPVDGKLLFNTLTTPRGVKYDLTLADGTKVTLDAASSITYPVAFAGKERRVEITGQAYFQVVHRESQPFKVSVKGQVIEDIGTVFNVSAYEDDPSVKITLAEGKVFVNNPHRQVSMSPGQQAEIKNGQSDISLKTVDVNEIVSWKNGWLIFHHESISNVMKQAARWYDIDVQYEGNLKSKKFGGVISRYKDISELLENLKITGGINYKIEGRRVVLIN